MKRSPTAAFWLSLIPGVGHVYLGQTSKGLLIILVAGSLIQFVDHGADGFGILIPFLWLFAMLDAHRTAQEINRAVDLGVEPPKSDAVPVSAWWGWVLIALGVIFTLDNFDIFRLEWIWDFWPLLLIGLGVYLLKRKPRPPAASPTPPPVETSTGQETSAEEHE
jgi:hypothetical protein